RPGVIAGAFAVGYIPEYLREAEINLVGIHVSSDSILDRLNSITGSRASDITEYRVALFGLALVLMMIFRPQGLLPNRQRAAELAEPGEEERLGAEPEPTDVGEGLVDDDAESRITAEAAKAAGTDIGIEIVAAETVLQIED